MYLRKITSSLAFTSIAIYAPLAAAQDAPPRTNTQETQIYLGGALLSSQDYTGSAENQLRVLPYIEIYNFHGFNFRPFALTYDLINVSSGEGLWGRGFKAGALASYDFGRAEDDGPELAGLGDLDGSIIGGGYGQLRLGPVAFRLEGGQSLSGGHEGARFDASVGTRVPVGKGSITAALTTRWGNKDFNQNTFGISASQAAASLFTAHAIDDGIYSSGATVLMNYPIGETWSATALASYQKFTGGAADSPIITAQSGSDTEQTLVLAISRQFGWGK